MKAQLLIELNRMDEAWQIYQNEIKSLSDAATLELLVQTKDPMLALNIVRHALEINKTTAFAQVGFGCYFK